MARECPHSNKSDLFSHFFMVFFLPNLRAVPDVDISCIAAFSAVETAPVGRLKTG